MQKTHPGVFEDFKFHPSQPPAIPSLIFLGFRSSSGDALCPSRNGKSANRCSARSRKLIQIPGRPILSVLLSVPVGAPIGFPIVRISSLAPGLPRARRAFKIWLAARNARETKGTRICAPVIQKRIMQWWRKNEAERPYGGGKARGKRKKTRRGGSGRAAIYWDSPRDPLARAEFLIKLKLLIDSL